MCILFTLYRLGGLLRANSLSASSSNSTQSLPGLHLGVQNYPNESMFYCLNQPINQLIHLLIVYWVLIGPGTVMVPILHLLGYKVQGRRHLYFTHSIQLWAADSSASLLFLKQILLCLSSMWLHKSSSSISQKKNWQRFLVPFSSTSHLPRPYTPAKLGTYLELVLLVPPVMLLEAKLQPRSSSCPGRAVSRKLLQGSTLKSY